MDTLKTISKWNPLFEIAITKDGGVVSHKLARRLKGKVGEHAREAKAGGKLASYYQKRIPRLATHYKLLSTAEIGDASDNPDNHAYAKMLRDLAYRK